MRKFQKACLLFCMIACLSLFSSACTNTAKSDTDKANLQTSERSASYAVTKENRTSSSSEDVAVNSAAEQYNAMTNPDFEFSKLSETEVSLQLIGDLTNVDIVRAYRLSVNSENGGKVTKILQGEFSADKISDGIINISPDDNLSVEFIEKDNSDIKCGYSYVGYQVEYANENEAILSDCHAAEILIDTGTVNQYEAELAGETACGAAAGTLIIQSIAPVWENELTERMSTVRSYSAISDEYSIGEPEYYMFGRQISNSVNKYLADNGIEGFTLTDFRTEKSTEETLVSLISTGRPAVLEVCYIGGNIVSDFQGYSHWITVNGFRLTDNGYEFRCEDTISLDRRWISSEMLDTSNANVSYGGGMSPTRYICSINNAVIDSFV